jgi:hypothetical protein
MPEALPLAICPSCRHPMTSTINGKLPGNHYATASKYGNCVRRCLSCRIGASNAKSEWTHIFEDPVASVPPEVSVGVREALAGALNEINRGGKRIKFGFDSSEDAVTWTIFSFLARSGQLSCLMGRLLPDVWRSTESNPVLLVWGSPLPPDGPGLGLRTRLVEISRNLDEDPRSRSEPDIVVQNIDGAIVKLRSGNDVKPREYAGWGKDYLKDTDAFRDPDRVRDSGSTS